MEEILRQFDVAGQYLDMKSQLQILSFLDALAIHKKDSKIIKDVRGRISSSMINGDTSSVSAEDIADIFGLEISKITRGRSSCTRIPFNQVFEFKKPLQAEILPGPGSGEGTSKGNSKGKSHEVIQKKHLKRINEVLGIITELPEEFREQNRKALEVITEIQNDTKSEALDSIRTATFIKGEAFEQLVGVFLAYKYPEEKIIPQYCLIVDPQKGYYGLRADYKVGNDIYEIKWGGATEAIDECTEKQIKHIQEGMNYKLISCVLNEKTKETFTPFLEEVKEKLKNDDCVEIFSNLTEKLKELANLDDVETLKKYRNAFFSIYVNAMGVENRQEYIEEMTMGIATTTNLDKFIKANDLEESPASLDANFEYKENLYQGKVLFSKHQEENVDKFKEEKDVEEGAEDLPRANENNELIIDGDKYLNIYQLGKLQTIDAGGKKIKKIIKENNIQGIKAKSRSKICYFYPVEEVKKYTNANKDLPRANENNELIIDGKKYLTIRALSKLETINGVYAKIKKIIKENNIQSEKGRDKVNRICNFYPVEEVKKHFNS